jgi:hypothetical protein
LLAFGDVGLVCTVPIDAGARFYLVNDTPPYLKLAQFLVHEKTLFCGRLKEKCAVSYIPTTSIAPLLITSNNNPPTKGGNILDAFSSRPEARRRGNILLAVLQENSCGSPHM